MDRKAAGDRIRAARKIREWSQVKMASEVECDPTTIARVERGEVDASADLIVRIAQKLEVSIDSLLLGSPEDGRAEGADLRS